MATKTKTKEKAKKADPVPVVEKKMTPNEKKLAEKKLHPRYEHYRFDDRSAITSCQLENNKNVPVVVGFAVCSHKDNFCRATGRKQAMNRAMAALNAERNLFPIMKHHGSNGKNEAMHMLGAESDYMAVHGLEIKKLFEV